MRSDFINKREIYRRRTPPGSTGGTFTEYELILLPKFDTFIYHQTANVPSGSEDWNLRWQDVLAGGANPNTSQEIPVGLLNPWNDGGPPSGGPGGGFGFEAAPRTPTRTVMLFDLSQIPAGAFILDSQLKLTVSSKAYWDSPIQPFTYEDPGTVVYGIESEQALQDLQKTDTENAEQSDNLPSTGIPSGTQISEVPPIVEIPQQEDSPAVATNWLLFYSSIA